MALSFNGDGWDSLKSEISKAQTVLIGEQHGETAIPLYKKKVVEVFKLNVLVVEIEPYTAGK